MVHYIEGGTTLLFSTFDLKTIVMELQGFKHGLRCITADKRGQRRRVNSVSH